MHGLYAFEGMRNGTTMLAMWCRDGNVDTRAQWSWQSGESGNGWRWLSQPKGLAYGEYELRIYVAGSLAQYGKFSIEKQSPGAPSVGTIQFAEGQKDDNPVNLHTSSQSFKYGIKTVYGFFERWYQPQTIVGRAEWYLNGALNFQMPASPDSGGGVVNLVWYSHFHKEQTPLDRGNYELRYYLDDRLVQRGTFVIQ